MLARIMAILREAGRPMCPTDLSRDLDIDPSALEGMLATLVARGRLRAIDVEGPVCAGCPLSGGCYLMREHVGVIYALSVAEHSMSRPPS